jgi:hypothetical protein
MKAQIMYNNDTIIKVKNCLCSDGKRRTVNVTGKTRKFFTPARVRVKGRSVSGFIAAFSWRDDAEFYEYFHRKNGYALKVQHND